MKRPLLLAALADSSSELVINAFWATLPDTIRSHYQYTSFVWHSPMEVIECLQKLTPAELMDTMVVMEPPSEAALPWDVERIGRDERGFAVSLVLSFPEVYFVFLGKMPPSTPSSPVSERRRNSIQAAHFVSWSTILRLAELIRHHKSSFRTLFDPSGLRNFLKLKLFFVHTNERRGLQYLSHVQLRLEQQAAVADEEGEYAYLHGYCLYRMGYVAVLLGTEEEFRYQLEEGDERCYYLDPPKLLITDWDLAYPDHEDARVPRTENAGSALHPLHKLLDELTQPVLVVTGYPSDPELTAFKTKSGLGRGSRESISKPHGGIFSIKSKVEELCGSARLAVADASSLTDDTGNDYFRHSLPFGRAIIVDSLIKRAEKVKHDGPLSVGESILQAVLALEAKELLGEISRTAAYSATYLQIDGELSAELSWFGVRLEAEVDRRIKEIEQESHQMLRGERQRIALRAALGSSSASRDHSTQSKGAKHFTDEQESNYLYRVFDLMRDSYNRNGQIEAGEKCHRKILEWRGKIPPTEKSWIARKRSWLAKRVFSYPYWVTADGTGVGRILLVSAGMILGFSVCYGCLLLALHSPELGSLRKLLLLALGNGIFSFVGLQPGLDEYKEVVKNAHPSDLWRLWNFLVALFEILIAYLNLGLLLSVVYRKLTRAAV